MKIYTITNKAQLQKNTLLSVQTARNEAAVELNPSDSRLPTSLWAFNTVLQNIEQSVSLR